MSQQSSRCSDPTFLDPPSSWALSWNLLYFLLDLYENSLYGQMTVFGRMSPSQLEGKQVLSLMDAVLFILFHFTQICLSSFILVISSQSALKAFVWLLLAGPWHLNPQCFVNGFHCCVFIGVRAQLCVPAVIKCGYVLLSIWGRQRNTLLSDPC